MAGAKQWRLPCEHLNDMTAERAMHSEVSLANADKWADEERTPKQRGDGPRHVGQARLTKLLQHYDATVVVCNSCRRIKILDDGEQTAVHSGDPYHASRVGEWLVDADGLGDDTTGLRGQSD